MSTSPADSQKELALYERQLNFVESMVHFHPDSLDIFAPEELAVFNRYLLPDWEAVFDYRDYYRQMLQDDPSLYEKAHELLTRYVLHHEVMNPQPLLEP